MGLGEFGDQTQNSPTIPQKYADLLEVLVRKIRQDRKINPVFGEAIRIFGQTVQTQPLSDPRHPGSPQLGAPPLP